MNEFEKMINDYLDEFEKTDSVFKKKREDSKKPIEDCCSYIVSAVKESQRNAFTDGEVYQLARHFYDENIPAPSSKESCRVVCPSKNKAADEPAPAKRPSKSKAVEGQMSLFGGDGL